MVILTLINIFASTLLMTSLYAATRPILDRAGNPHPGRIIPVVLRTKRSRARERRNAVLLAAAGTALIVLINVFQFDGALSWYFVVGAPSVFAGIVYWYRRELSRTSKQTSH